MRRSILQPTYVVLMFLLAILIGVSFARNLVTVPAMLLGLLLVVTLVTLELIDAKIGLMVFIFALPFERIPSLQVGGVTVRISQVILISLLISFMLRALQRRTFWLTLSPYAPAYLLFLIALLSSFWHMQAITRGLEVCVFMIFTSLTIWIIPALVQDKAAVDRVVRVLFITTFLVSLFGLYQFVGDIIGLPTALTGLRELYTKAVFGFPRIQATALEPLYLANFLMIPLSLALTYGLRRVSHYAWWFLAAVITVPGLVLILTLARGGYVGMAASLVVILLGSVFFVLRPTVILSTLFGSFLVIIAVAALLNFSNLGQKSIDEVQKHFTQIQADASTEQRLSTFDQAIEAFNQSPYTGVGIGNFGPWVAGYPTELPKDGWAIVNNGPLEILAETGMVGAVACILFLYLLLLRSMQALFAAKDPFLRATMLGLVAAIVGVLAQYQFFSTFYIMHIWVLFGLAIAVQNIIFAESKRKA